MSRLWPLLLILLTSRVLADDEPKIYPPSPAHGPSQAIADLDVELAACREAHFQQSEAIESAIQSGDQDEILSVLGAALDVYRATSETAPLYSARALCIHQLVPKYLQRMDVPEHDSDVARQPTPTVKQFEKLGVSYWYYADDGDWVVENPIDLMNLETKHLDSRWGREAFLMMTRLGWSQGNCKEGPDHQFREVIRRGEEFLNFYPESETTNSVRFEVAEAYATWWTLSVSQPRPPYFSPEAYKPGGEQARTKAIALLQQYIEQLKTRNRFAEPDLKALQQKRPFRQIMYHCEDYED